MSGLVLCCPYLSIYLLISGSPGMGSWPSYTLTSSTWPSGPSIGCPSILGSMLLYNDCSREVTGYGFFTHLFLNVTLKYLGRPLQCHPALLYSIHQPITSAALRYSPSPLHRGPLHFHQATLWLGCW